MICGLFAIAGTLYYRRTLNFRETGNSSAQKASVCNFYQNFINTVQNSLALNFREFCRFANLCENKVLTKIWCFTVASN